jgi:WhiB family redox-sensing transcriptional regulator
MAEQSTRGTDVYLATNRRRCSTPFALMSGRWVQRGACRGHPIARFFPKGGATVGAAKAVCAECVVRSECLAYALAEPQLQGVWGGTSDTERRALRRRAA